MKVFLFLSILMSFSFGVFAKEEYVCVDRDWMASCVKYVQKSDTVKGECSIPGWNECFVFKEQEVCVLSEKTPGQVGSTCKKFIPLSDFRKIPPLEPEIMLSSPEDVEEKAKAIDEIVIKSKVQAEQSDVENSDYKCGSGVISEMSDEVNSCNFLEESMLNGEGDRQSGLHGVFEVGSLMLLQDHYNNQDYRLASPTKCEECHKKAFDIFFEGQNYEEVKEGLEDRIKEQDIANAFDKLLDESVKMRQFFNHHKSIFEEDLAANSVNLKSSATMPQSMDFLNKSNQKDQYDLVSEVGQNPLERFEMSLTCFKLREVQKIADANSQGEDGKSNCLDKVNTHLNKYFNNSQKVKDLLSGSGEFDENESKIQQDETLQTAVDLQGFKVSDEAKEFMGDNGINDFFNVITGVLYRDFDKINDICKEVEFIEEDTPRTKVNRSHRIAEQILLGKMENPDREESKVKAKRLIPELVNVNPSFYYFLNDSSELCETMKFLENNREGIKKLRLKDLIERNASGIDQTPLSSQEKMAKLESDAENLYKLTCNASEQAIVNMICNEELEDRPNLEEDFALLESDDKLRISDAEQMIMNEEICKRQAPKPVQEGFRSSRLLAENENAPQIPPILDITDDSSKNVIAQLKSSELSFPNKKDVYDGLRNVANQEVNDVAEEIAQYTSGGAGVGSSDADRPRNSLPADIINADENPASVQEVRDIFSGLENNTVASTATFPPVENEISQTLEKAEEPNEFSRMLNQMQNNAQNLNAQANNFVSGKSYNDMINSGEIPEPTKSEIQDVLATDANLGESIGDAATKYLKGDNSEQLLTEAISGDKNAEDALLEQVKNKDEIDELKAEIEKLKKGAYVSAAEKKALERAQAAEEKVKKLEERLARFEKVEAAKTNNQPQAGNSGGSFNNSLGVSAGGASGSLGKQRLAGGFDTNSNASNNFRSVSAQQGKSEEKNVIKQIPIQVKINPEQWIKKSDFVIQSDESGFFLQIVDQGLTHKDRVPLTPRDVKFDNVDNPQYVMIKDIVVPIKFSTLDNKTKAELKALVGQNPQPEFTQVDAAVKELQAAEVELEMANQEVNHYKNFRSCLLNPSQKICN